MLKIELNNHTTSNLGGLHRETLILPPQGCWLLAPCPGLPAASRSAVKPQCTTADEGIIFLPTTTVFRSSINTVKLARSHYKLVFHLVKADGLTALETAAVGS